MTHTLKVSLLGILFAVTGCASIVDGKHQTMTFSSTPQGAEVVFNGLPIGVTPVTVPVRRHKDPATIKFTKEGYKDHQVATEAALNRWFLGNIITGGLYGSTTDYLTGAMNEFYPGHFMVTLIPLETTPLPGGISQTDQQKIVNFIVVGYTNLMIELNNNPGQYLASLFALAGTPENERAIMQKKLRALSEVYTVIPDFAHKASEILLTK